MVFSPTDPAPAPYREEAAWVINLPQGRIDLTLPRVVVDMARVPLPKK
jgi:hypothetical protein